MILKGYKDTQKKRESSCRLSGLASMIHNVYLWRTPSLRMLVMMHMRVGLQHLLNDPVGLIYTPELLSLICMYFTQYWLPPRVCISCCSIIIHVNDYLQSFFKLSILNCNSYIVILFYWADRLESRTYLLNVLLESRTMMVRKQDPFW